MKVASILRRESLAGIVVTAVGAFVTLEAFSYPIGSMRTPGPGGFPLLLGIVLTLAGLGITFFDRDAPGEESPDSFTWRPAAAVLLSVVVFAALIERAGLVPAIFAAVTVVSLAQPGLDARRIVIVSTFMSVVTSLIFVVMLSLQFKVVAW